MALGDVLAAIKTRWDGKSLSDTVTGGIHSGRAKSQTAPYVICSQVASAVPFARAARNAAGQRTRYESVRVQLLLYDRSGPNAAKTKAASIKAAFDNAPLSVSGASLLQCKFDSEIVMNDPEQPGNPNAVLWALVFEVQTSEAETLNPS